MRTLHDPATLVGVGAAAVKPNLGLTAEDRFSLTMQNLNFRAALRNEGEIPVNQDMPNLPFKPADRVFAPDRYSFPEGEVSTSDRALLPDRLKAAEAGSEEARRGLFNTKLTADEERDYNKWVETQSKKLGRDLSKDTTDYDLRGYWKETKGASLDGGHLTDTYKKPWHPTFSMESQYSGTGNNAGGVWGREGDKDTFTPGPANYRWRSRGEIMDYFMKYEPHNRLILPRETGDRGAAYRAGMGR